MCECVRIEKPAFIINQKEIFSVLKDCFLFIFVLKEKNTQMPPSYQVRFFEQICLSPPKKLFENQNPNQNQSCKKKNAAPK